MYFPFYIAWRYLFSKKRQNFINIISAISVSGITLGTAALIIVLSVFNGFENIVISLYNSFDPDIKISLSEGKNFDLKTFPCDELKKIGGIKQTSETLEETVLLKYRDKQFIGVMKGVDGNFLLMSGLDSMVSDGTAKLESADTNFAITGAGIAYHLSLNIHDPFSLINIYAPKRGEAVTINPEDAFNHGGLPSSGIFSIQQDFDNKYIIVPVRFARELLDYTDRRVSALELSIDPRANKEKIIAEIQQLIGTTYKVEDRLRQHELLYKIMASEKWAVYLILSFILLIATFNVIGSLTMLIIDKKQDIGTLYSLGVREKNIQLIFLMEGLLISLSGAFTGLFLGFIACFLQEKYGLIRLQGSGTFVIESYPVSMNPADFFYVLSTVLAIGVFAAWYPARQIIRKHMRIPVALLRQE